MPLVRKQTAGSIRIHRLIGYGTVVHAALVTLFVFAAIRYGLFADWFNRWWVAFVTLWVFWLFPLFLHRGRSALRVVVPLIVAILLIAPSAHRFTLIAPRVFEGTARMPTLDRPNIVGSQNLGGGFRRVTTEELVTHGFESIYHGAYLYFQKQRLSYFVSSSLSPSRAFAAYAALDYDAQPIEKQHPFHVYLFRAVDRRTFQANAQPIYYDGEFRWEWHEAEGYVLVHFKDGRHSEQFRLPRGPNPSMKPL